MPPTSSPSSLQSNWKASPKAKDRGTKAFTAAEERVQFYSGDDAAAKAEVHKPQEAIGYSAVDLGALEVGGRLAQLPFGALAATNFIKI